MLNLFLSVLNMSVTAALAALVIICLRGSLGRALPRTFSYALWMIVLYRMIVPFSFSSIFSALGSIKPSLDTYTTTLKSVSRKGPLDVEVLSVHGAQELTAAPYPQANAQIEMSDGLAAMNLSVAPAPADYFAIAVVVLWFLGIFVLLFYNAASYGRFCRSFETATLCKEHELMEECKSLLRMGRRVSIYISDRTESPFVYGFLRPRILLPSFVANPSDEQSRERLRHILLHELFHIKRLDYLVKPLAFLGLCVHWFNPVLWIAFRLFGKDMEMSCDEGVVKALKMGGGDYAATLLNMASTRDRGMKSCALAFHETNVGERVKHIVKYKKPGEAASVIIVALLILCAASLLSNPASLAEDSAGGQTNVLVMCNAEGSDYPDTILLLGYNSDRKEIGIAFLPRDLAVLSTAEAEENSEVIRALPSYKAGEHILYNASLLHDPRKLFVYAARNPHEDVAGKLSEILGVEIHNYVKLDTTVFRDLVDALGGVEFDVPMRMVYEDPYQNLSIDLEKGKQVLDGKRAEMLIRYRKGYSEGDLARIEVEKVFVAAMIEQKSDIKIGSLHKIYQALSGRIETNLDMKEAKRMITLFLTGDTTVILDLPVEPASEDSRARLFLTTEAKEQLKKEFGK